MSFFLTGWKKPVHALPKSQPNRRLWLIFKRIPVCTHHLRKLESATRSLSAHIPGSESHQLTLKDMDIIPGHQVCTAAASRPIPGCSPRLPEPGHTLRRRIAHPSVSNVIGNPAPVRRSSSTSSPPGFYIDI
jgi:hypothetical protein